MIPALIFDIIYEERWMLPMMSFFLFEPKRHHPKSEESGIKIFQNFTEFHSVSPMLFPPPVLEFTRLLTEKQLHMNKIQSCIHSLYVSKCKRSAQPISWFCPLPLVSIAVCQRVTSQSLRTEMPSVSFAGLSVLVTRLFAVSWSEFS